MSDDYEAPRSDTDLAAGAAFDAIRQVLEEQGHDPAKAFMVMLIALPDGTQGNTTCAGVIPGHTDSFAMVGWAVDMLNVAAREHGLQVVMQSMMN
jgi:hypothetical protein